MQNYLLSIEGEEKKFLIGVDSLGRLHKQSGLEIELRGSLNQTKLFKLRINPDEADERYALFFLNVKTKRIKSVGRVGDSDYPKARIQKISQESAYEFLEASKSSRSSEVINNEPALIYQYIS